MRTRGLAEIEARFNGIRRSGTPWLRADYQHEMAHAPDFGVSTPIGPQQIDVLAIQIGNAGKGHGFAAILSFSETGGRPLKSPMLHGSESDLGLWVIGNSPIFPRG